jgi:uncharacterized membrane protein YvbJ
MVKTATGFDSGDGDDITDCPECGAEIYMIADRCPKCGHWFVEKDRRAMRSRRRNDESIAEESRELRIVKIGAILLLGACLVFGLVALIVSR